MVRKLTYGFFLFLILLFIVWILGPRAKYDQIDDRPSTIYYEIESLDSIIAVRESQITNLKKDNEARIVWNDTIPHKTEYSFVYLHGYTASQGEGAPIHTNLAKQHSANLYLARLKDHGIDNKEAFKNLTPQDWVDDAKEAIAIGKSIGEKVILVSCSTGSTLSILLAAVDKDIHALVLLSPNIKVVDKSSALLTGPWGRQLLYTLIGEYIDRPSNQYWSGTYHLNGLIALQYLLEETMHNETFQKITQPVYMGYYYKNEEEQDQVVSVPAMLKFYEEIKTPENLKRKIAFGNAGSHVISSKYKNENWSDVEKSIDDFLTEIISIN